MSEPKLKKMRKLVETQHDWMLVAVVGDDHPQDEWNWCKNCGTLMCNGEEFFFPGVAGLKAEHPVGSYDEPSCPPPKSS